MMTGAHLNQLIPNRLPLRCQAKEGCSEPGIQTLIRRIRQLIVIAAVLLSGQAITSPAFAQELTEDAAKLNERWREAWQWVVDSGKLITNEAIYQHLEYYCKQWEWPKSRCEQGFADLVAFRDEYFRKQREAEAERERREQELGYD